MQLAGAQHMGGKHHARVFNRGGCRDRDRPRGGAPALAQNAYITDYFGSSVSVISTPSNTVIATIPVGQQPVGVAVTPEIGRA